MGTFSEFERRDWGVSVALIAIFVALALVVTAVTGWPVLAIMAVLGIVEGGVAVMVLAPAIRRGQER